MMPEEQRFEIDRMGIKDALDQRQTTGESLASRFDVWQVQTIMDECYEWGVYENKQSGLMERVILKCKYPDLKIACGVALSHLNKEMNYDWPESRGMALDWRGLYYNPLRFKYSRDDIALGIITALDRVYNRDDIGGSASGSHQLHEEKLTGSHRTVEVTQREREEGRR